MILLAEKVKACKHMFTNTHMDQLYSVTAQIQTTVLKPVKGILGNEILNRKAPREEKLATKSMNRGTHRGTHRGTYGS